VSFRWPFSPKKIKPVLSENVVSSPLPDEEKRVVADALGMQILGEVMHTFELSGLIREKLADGVLLEVRGKKR
jgi:hypothetical protein